MTGKLHAYAHFLLYGVSSDELSASPALYSVSAIARNFANGIPRCGLRYHRANSRALDAMTTIEPIDERNGWAFKIVRLRALQDSPLAFGSTYAREAQFDDAEWRKRTAYLSGERGIGFLAMDKNAPCGIIGALPDQDGPGTAQIVSMWVAPTHRRSGLGTALIDAVRSWSQTRGIRTLRLMVTSRNYVAMEFYRRNGFTMTGKTGPYPNDASIIEHEMALSLPT
jgi:ribosomal protein S18 acetylase RimI-like enzyme